MGERRVPRVVLNDLLSGAAATATLGATFFGLDLPVLAAAGVAVAVYAGTRLLLSSDQVPSTAAESGRDAVSTGRDQLRQLQLVAKAVDNPSARASIDRIVSSGQRIYALFEADPGKLRAGRGLAEFTLGRTLTIVRRYVELSRSGAAVALPTLDRAEQLLDTIDASLRAQIEQLMRDDVSDLDSEIEVLNSRLEFEGNDPS
jgi:5-bromo-4-chloroindolyl phosphate hydrolysis protein